jgi:hypothetical protein
MTDTNPAPQPNGEDRRKHLEFVQAVITRLAQSSAAAKGWSLTVAAAAFGFSAVQSEWYLGLLGLVALIAFGRLDVHYLHQERLYRDLFDAVRHDQVEPYSMDNRPFDTAGKKREAYESWSVRGFYIPLLIIGLIAIGAAFLHNSADEKRPHPSDRHEHCAGHHGRAHQVP